MELLDLPAELLVEILRYCKGNLLTLSLCNKFLKEFIESNEIIGVKPFNENHDTCEWSKDIEIYFKLGDRFNRVILKFPNWPDSDFTNKLKEQFNKYPNIKTFYLILRHRDVDIVVSEIC